MSADAPRRLNIHATGLLLDGAGVLIRGPSGAGKSLLALELLDRYALMRRPALLVADDRLEIERRGQGLLMHAPPVIAGLVELRGRGLIRRPYIASAPVHLVVDLVEDWTRMLEESEFETDLFGLALPRSAVPRRGMADPGHQLLLVMEALASLPSTARQGGEKTT